MKLITIVFILFTFLFSVESSFAETPPKFWIKNLEGKRFNSKKQKSPYVISFFFVHCVPCIKEIPLLHKFMSTNFPDVPLLFIDPIKSKEIFIPPYTNDCWECHLTFKEFL